jgi:hypothetical protein
MRHLRLLLLSLLALAIAAPAASAQGPTAIPLPGGGQAKITIPAKKGKGKKKTKAKTHLVEVGIADQKKSMFTDPRFISLGLKTARRSVAWDTFIPGHEWQIPEVDEWLQAARADGVRPLITFARSRDASRIHLIPTRAQWLNGFKEFRKRYPWVTDFVASNESNHTPPTAKKPELAASYYKDMRLACRTCRIAAATINELPSKETKHTKAWVKRFIKKAGHQPKYWALHNYYGANTFSTKGTKRFLKMVKGQVWVTETGGLVKRRSGNFAGKVKMKEGLAHSTKAWRFIFDNMLTLSPRLTKVYLYHWDSSSATDTWDSALVGYDGRARGGLAILKAKLSKRRR